MKDGRISVSAATLLGALILGVGFFAGFDVAHNRVGASLLQDVAPPEGVDLTPVWKAWRILDERFVPAAVATTSTSTDPYANATEEERRVWGMIQGLAASTGDPYTFFLPPSENKQFNEDMSGRFEGVGMEIAVREQQLMVVAPLKGTPADRAGIRAGDRILRIDDASTEGMDVGEAVDLIRGPKGSTVKLTIQRNGERDERMFEVVRDVINVPIITTEIQDDVFIIQISIFTANSPNLFRDALREFVESGKTKLVIDLRGNAGGYLGAAVDMASWFLPSGRVVVTEDYAGHARNLVHRSSGYDIFNDNLKMVILVNRGSASSAEILAEALRYWGKATLVGTRTFGKGSVQELIPITEDTSLKVTIARWLGPGGDPIPFDGIEPDVKVDMTEEDFEAGRDPQLERAIELLNS